MANTIDQIKQRITPEGIMSACGIHAKRKGYQWWACCPFHTEKTASFRIHMDRKQTEWRYTCHGCGVYGDLINLWANIRNNGNLKEAIKELVNNYGSAKPVYIKQKPADEIQTSNKSLQMVKDIYQTAKPICSITYNENLNPWQYFLSRHINLKDKQQFLHPNLRYHKNLSCGKLYDKQPNNLYPESSAIICGNLIDGKLTGLQRTYLKQDIGKFKNASGICKFSLGNLHNGLSPVWLGKDKEGKPLPPATKNETLVIFEGLEDALSYAIIHPNDRIAIGLGLARLKNIKIPDSFNHILLGADRPKKPIHKKQTDSALHKWTQDNKNAEIFYAPYGYDDYNDYICGEEL